MNRYGKKLPAKSSGRTAKSITGQATIEYVLLLSILIFGTFVMTKSLQAAWDRGILRLGGKLEYGLKTGRVPANAWKN